MSEAKYEGDNPVIKRLEETVDDFVSEVYLLNSDNTTSITPDEFTQCYRSIQAAPDSMLTNDSFAWQALGFVL